MADDVHKVLRGHEPAGLKFVPKILKLRKLHEVSYVRVMIPELSWLAVLNFRLGNQQAAKIVHAIAAELRDAQEMPRTWFPSITCCSLLSSELKSKLIEALAEQQLLDDLRIALDPFIELFPQFPGMFLASADRSGIASKNFLPEFKELIQRLYDPESSEAVFMCALAIYATFTLDMVRVDSTISLSRFPEIENYPRTEISIRIASSVRSLCLMLVRNSVVETNLLDWSAYFWNRGLTLEPIDWTLMERTK